MTTVIQSSFTAGVWADSLRARTDLKKYTSAVRVMENFFPHPHGGVSNRQGTIFVREIKDSSKQAILVPFQFSTVQSYVLEFGNTYMRVYKDGGIVLSSGSPYEISTPYAEADLARLKFEQSADVLYITHPSYAPRKLTRSGHTSWTLSTTTFGSSISAPAGWSRTSGTATGHYLVATAVRSNGEESLPTASSGSVGVGDVMSWTAVTGAQYYNIYETVNQKADGSYGWLARVSGTTYTIPANTVPDPKQGVPFARTVFNAANDYPSCSAFYEQRMDYAGATNNPQTLQGSVIGSYDNFNTCLPLRDDDAYNITIASRQVNEIRWMVGMDELIVGTAGGEWTLGSGTNSDAITPSNFKLKRRFAFGVDYLAPIVIGEDVLYLEGSRKRVRAISGNDFNGYKNTDQSILAQHLFDLYGIKSWAYQQFPDSLIWAVRDDGKLLGFTYNKEHEISGWHTHSTDGEFESVASIQTSDGSVDVYFIVKRTINGQTKRYVEMLATRDFTDIKDAFFVDCGLTYSGAPATTISGLSHLEGKTVSILADGGVYTNKVVTSGQIVLDKAASKVHVGLPYTCDLGTLDLDYQTQTGPIQDRLKVVRSALLLLKNTRACHYGPNENALDEVPFRSTEDYGQPTALFTGHKEVFLRSGNDYESRVYIRVTEPLPITVQAIMARIEDAKSR